MSRRLSRFKQFLERSRNTQRSTGGARATDVPIGPRGELYDIDPLTLEPIARVFENSSSVPPESAVHNK